MFADALRPLVELGNWHGPSDVIIKSLLILPRELQSPFHVVSFSLLSGYKPRSDYSVLELMAVLLNFPHGIDDKGFPQPYKGGDNYRTWKRRVFAILMREGMEDIINKDDACTDANDPATL